MYRNRWRSGPSGWWKSGSFDSPFSGSGKWKNTWPEKRKKKKKSAWQCAFDYLPDLDERFDLLDDALPLIDVPGIGKALSAQKAATETDNGSDDECDILFGSLSGNIVGVQYYKGSVNNNEMISLQREPSNKYDPNAVKVNNVVGQQVGHIKRELARALAPVLDRRLARVEGSVPCGAGNRYSMPVDLTVWGRSENKAEVVRLLKQCGYILKDGLSHVPSGGASFSGSYDGGIAYSAPNKRTFLNPVDVKSELDKLFEQLDEGDKTTEVEPCVAIATPLFTHQKQALSWMIRCENSDRLPPFWQLRGSQYFNSLTMFSTSTKPHGIRGGILADDMGLGKTLEIIALILSNFEDGKPLAVPVQNCIRPSRIAKLNRLKMYRQSVKNDSMCDMKPELKGFSEKSLAGSSKVLASNSRENTGRENTGRKKLLIKSSLSQAAGTATESGKTVEPKKLLLLGPLMDSNNNAGPSNKKTNCTDTVMQPYENEFACAEIIVGAVEQDLILVTETNFDLDVECKVVAVEGLASDKPTEEPSVPVEVTRTKKGRGRPATKTAKKKGVECQLVPECTTAVGDVCYVEPVETETLVEVGVTKKGKGCGAIKAAVKKVGKRKVDPDFCPNLEDIKPKLSDVVVSVSPNVRSRPKRTIRKPAMYRDDSDDETQESVECPLKKPKKAPAARRGRKAAPKEIESIPAMPTLSGIEPERAAQVSITDALQEHNYGLSGPESATNGARKLAEFDTETGGTEAQDPDIGVGEECVWAEMNVASSFSNCVAPAPVPCSSKGITSRQDELCVIDDSSSDDEKFPDLPDLEMAEFVVPPPASVNDYGQSTGRTKGKGPRSTLIICPLSTLSTWLDQIEQHVNETVQLQVHTYYGQSRINDAKLLAEHDIVLTTYQTLSSDNKGRSPLQKVHWLRVVLDEGHTIRNPNALMTKAVLALNADRKWIVTGTPIQNSIKDLWALMKFLDVDPFQDKQWWDRTIERPVMRGDQAAIKRIQSLLSSLTMRRMKTQIRNGKPIIELPKRDVFIEHIELTDDERQLYDSMQNSGKLLVSKYFKQGTLLHHYGEVLAIMMRLRQICCHPILVAKAASSIKEAIAEAEAEALEAGSTTTNTEDFRKKLIEKILMVLRSGSDEECAICLDELKTPVITPCAHLFCRPCIEQVINSEKQNAKCPMCRGPVATDTLVEVPPDYEEQQNELGDQPWYSSAKVDALMAALLRLRAEDPTIKSVVVSQFTSYLTLLETPLRNSGFHFARLDGTMTSKQRTTNIEAFSDTDSSSPTIFLLSLKAGGVGINLTAACRFFLMDPAWNPATEEQCFDRCHRLGQTRDVVITKFVVEDSVEERMLELQERKRKLVAGVLGGGVKQTPEEKRNTRIEEIKKLIDL